MSIEAAGNAIVFTQGGPTPVINASWVGVAEGMKDASQVGRVFGALHGIEGIINQQMIDLTDQPAQVLEQCVLSPASALLSTRHQPTDQDCARILDVCRKHNVRFVFGIGGNDTSEALDIVNDAARKQGYELRLFHVPKTIDCDLVLNDHTPGYPSAARFVAQAFMGVDLDNACFGGIYLGVCMGRHAGWLTAASALGRRNETEGPHLIYLPERPFDTVRLLEEVYAIYDRLGRCVIAASEGIEDADGTPVLEILQGQLDQDPHKNVQLSGTGALADGLMEMIKDYIGQKRPDEKLRARADTLGYVQRSYPDQSAIDQKEARDVGRFAAQMALAGNIDGSITIKRERGPEYKVRYELVELSLVAGKTRCMPDEYINAAGNHVTQAFIDWARPLVGELAAKPTLGMNLIKAK